MRKLFFATLSVVGCGNGSVHSDADAMKAHLGLDASVDKAINLGFAGFNAATSANIPTELTTGTVKGTLTVTGQVDQGASSNKTMPGQGREAALVAGGAAADRPLLTTAIQRRIDAASTVTVHNMSAIETAASSQPWKLPSLRKLFTVDK